MYVQICEALRELMSEFQSDAFQIKRLFNRKLEF